MHYIHTIIFNLFGGENMICPKCHAVNDDEEKFCKNCGFQLNSARICPTCGKTNDSNSKYCKECGTVLTPVNTFRKQVIEEKTKKSFFSMYKVPIICALVIILAIGAVTGMAYYNGGSGGDDGFSTIIPTDDNGFFNDDINNDPTQAQIQNDNKTNDTKNDTNKSKTLTEKIDNKTNKTSKNINDTVNKIKNQTNSSKSVNSSSVKNTTSKTITEKVNKTAKSDKNKSDKSRIADSDKNDSGINSIIPGMSTDSDDNLNDTEGNDLDDNDTNDLNESNSENLSDSSLNEIEMEDVPNLAQLVSQKNYAFSTIEYDGNEYDEGQCIYIFSEYLLNIDKNKGSSIEIKDVKKASNPSDEDLSQSIDKADYLSMAQRVYSWMDQKDTVPNYVGISGMGTADLSPKMMLKLFTLATLEYSITQELPESVDI